MTPERITGVCPPPHNDFASTAFWRQAEPHAPFPALGADEMEVI